MADIDVVKKPSAGSAAVGRGPNATIMMIIAFLAVAGLMAWLAMESARRPVAQVNESAPAAAEATEAEAVQGVAFSEIAANPAAYEGQTVTVTEMPVGSTLGPRLFWADIPMGQPFIVLVPAGVQGVAAGQTVSVDGTVRPINEQVLGEWVATGALEEGMRPAAEAASHYLEVGRVR
jgi:hypothetical protein